MTAAQIDTITGQRIAPFAADVVPPIAALTGVLHCFAAVFGGVYWFDELYMLAIGRYHLDWGSADQPPVAPALAALTDAVAPGSLIALRVPAVLATAGGLLLPVPSPANSDVIGAHRDSRPRRRQRVCGRHCSGTG